MEKWGIFIAMCIIAAGIFSGIYIFKKGSKIEKHGGDITKDKQINAIDKASRLILLLVCAGGLILTIAKRILSNS